MILSLVFILPLLVLTAEANFEDLGSSARPMGMGNAFTALANDVNALYYNPAGLANLTAPELTSSYTRYLIGVSDDSPLGGGYLAAALPLGEGAGLGIGYNNFNLSGYYQEHTITLGYGMKVLSNLSAGLNVKGLFSTIGQDAYTAIDPLFQQFGYSTSAISFDLGFVYQLLPQYRLALSIANVNQPNLALSGNDNVPMTVKAGFAYRTYGMDVVSDVAYQSNNRDLDFYFGAEKWFAERTIAVRAGLGIGSREDRDASVGASYRTDNFQFDYAFLYPLAGLTRTIGTHRMALSVRFGEVEKESESEYGIVPMVPRSLLEDEMVKMREANQSTQEQVEHLMAQLAAQEQRLASVAPATGATAAPDTDASALKNEIEENRKKFSLLMERYADSQSRLNELEVESKARKESESAAKKARELEDVTRKRKDLEAEVQRQKDLESQLKRQKELEDEIRRMKELEARIANKPVAVVTPPVKPVTPVAPVQPPVKVVEPAPKPVVTPPVKPTMAVATPDTNEIPKTYTVASGDTLQTIAKKFYGDEAKWVEVYRMNKDRIKQGILTPGQVLILPQVVR